MQILYVLCVYLHVVSNIRMLLFYLSLFLGIAQICNAQNGVVFAINGTDGLVYLLLTIIFGINFVTPILMWIYSNYLEQYVEKVTGEIEKVQKRISERISDAGRKVSEQMR